MTFARQSLIKISAGDVEPAAAAVIKQIQPRLQNQKQVLWLVSGGSAVDVAVAVRARLQQNELMWLTVGLVDERCGPAGHPDSNATALVNAGFEVSNVEFARVLRGKAIEETAEDYDKWLQFHLQLSEVDYTIGLFGIGADGHTAGLLPGSPLLTSSELFGAFEADDYQRLSVTPKLILQLDAAVVYAVGESKWPALNQLFYDENNQLPANILAEVNDLQIFSDVKLGKKEAA